MHVDIVRNLDVSSELEGHVEARLLQYCVTELRCDFTRDKLCSLNFGIFSSL